MDCALIGNKNRRPGYEGDCTSLFTSPDLGVDALSGYERALEAEPQQRNLLAWASVVSLPRVLSLADDGTLAIAPAPELEALRLRPRRMEEVRIDAGREATLRGISGNGLELFLRIDPGAATEVGVKVLCSPDGSEQTTISYLPGERKLQVDFRRSSLADDLQYWDFDPDRAEAFHTAGTVQAAPFRLAEDEFLDLRVFIDRSVIEVFANGRQSLTQRVYPTRADSIGVRLFAAGGAARASVVEAWDMEPVAPW